MDRKFRGVSARGNRIQISFMYEDERCREIIPLDPTAKNMKEANEIRQMILTQIKLGSFDYGKQFPNSPKAMKYGKNIADKTTIEERLNEWLRLNQKRLQSSTMRDYVGVINCHLIPQFGHLYLSELTTTDVRHWISNQSISNKRINNILIPLRAIYEDAYEEEIITKNPLRRIKSLSVVTREPNPFTDTEINAILNQLKGNDKNLIQFAFETGLRTSELVGLYWEDIDFEQKRIYVRRAIVRNKIKEPKTRSGIRTVDLSEHAINALNDQQQIAQQNIKNVFFDTKNKVRLDDQKIRKRIWRPALAEANVTYREPYQTRHTFASKQLSSGKPALWVSTQMGHSNPIMTTSKYARWIK